MPLISIHRLALIGLVARLAVAFASDRIAHPDELFQYLEQAHRLAFGYGYIPWEYRFGTRSWILPGLISAILFFAKVLGVDDPATYIAIVKVVFCFISVSLIYSVYVIAGEIAGPKAGTLSAAFTSCWYELVYVAHKATPEILSTYLIAAALACVVVIRSDQRHPVLLGFFCAGAVILRLQYLPALAPLVLFAWIRWRKYDLLTAAGTFVMLLTFAGYIDYVTWGSLFASYYNNYLWNAVYGLSELWGSERLFFFIESLTIASAGIFAITTVRGKMHDVGVSG